MGNIRLYGSTSGYTELAPPAVAGDNTLILPANGFGKVLQVVNATKVDVFSTASTSYVDVTGLSVSITPYSTSSTVLVFVNASVAHSSNDTNNIKVRLMRNATLIASQSNNCSFIHYNTNDNYDANTYSFTFLDSPTTVASTTYKIQASVSAGTGYFNRASTGSDAISISSIAIMEVAA